MQINYTSTAYNSQNIRLQPKPTPKGGLASLLSVGQTLLPWTQPINNLCTAIYAGMLPSEYQRVRQQRGGVFDDWNHKTLTVYTGSNALNVMNILALVGQAFVLWGGGVVLASCLLFWLIGVESEKIITVFLWYLIPLGLPGLIVWQYKGLHLSGKFRLKCIERKLAAIKFFELSRETGMVTLFAKDGSVVFSHPFLEFDCIFESSVMMNGVYVHRLMLKHRYSTHLEGIPLHNMMTIKDIESEYYNLWNMIQMYMDISQPLPDAYYLEEFREFDPTTKAYDEHIGRNPRFWRDMTDEKFVEVMSTIDAEQRASRVQLGPEINIFQAA